MITTQFHTLNALPILSNSPIFVTNQDSDESTDSNYEPVKHVEEDSNSSEEGQKGTAVIAIINTATRDHAS